ncbi:unnamed protein product, partial [Angiostrongylus costaricensis]|uniref:Acetyl xylan esterase n=1 Tax=Angiostrongylus costaricensis TaxID=334426 RepID=A0A158PHI2_ANGCS
FYRSFAISNHPDGNFWDDDVHDYADLTWDTVEVLMNKIASLPVSPIYSFPSFGGFQGDNVLLLLHNVIQLPLSLLAASRIGIVSVILVSEDSMRRLPVLVANWDRVWPG